MASDEGDKDVDAGDAKLRKKAAAIGRLTR
jgi:hypothetical protein